MAAPNASPIFSKTPKIGILSLNGNVGLTRSDGVGTIGTDMFLAFTADATNGSFIQRIRLSPVASAAATLMTASVIRFYLSSKTSGATTAADTTLIHEFAVGALTAAHATNGVNFYEIPMNFALQPGYTILASIHANLAANTRWQVTVFAGDY